MLIGQFCETYPPSIDGVGRVMYSYCKGLQALGHRAPYIAPVNRRYPEPIDCEAYLYGGMRIPGEAYSVGIPRLSRRYRRAVKDLRFDVLHAHSPFLGAREARRLAKRDGAPLVATFHSQYDQDFLKKTHSRLLTKAGIRMIVHFFDTCDEVWAVSRQSADILKSYGYRGDPVVMYNGTDGIAVTDEEREAVLSRYPLRDGVATFIFIGQQNFKKNPQSVLRACGLLKKKGFAFQLIMIGSGPDEDRLHALTKELGIQDDVIFTGFINDRTTVMVLYERSDLLVFPSLYDTSGLVVREAAAMGTPALLIAGSCAAEGIEHGVNGYLCRNDSAEIADMMMKACEDTEAVGRKAKETIPIPWETILSQALVRYRLLIQKKSEGNCK